MDITAMVEENRDELIALRREFHLHPELGFQEFSTQKKIMRYLTSIGLSPKPIAGTGVVALLEGPRPGKTVMLRADMDALPVTEETGLPFASCTEGMMHACGHDGHMAMLLIGAKVLTSVQASIAGTIKFVFQPNEEDAGAYKLIEEKVMESPHVDAVFGVHLWSQLPSGRIDIIDGPQMAASHYFSITIKGKGGHAGFAHESIDPIIAATSLVQTVQAIQTREINALDPAVIMFTQIHAGSNMTIVPEEVKIDGSIRFLSTHGQHLFDSFERMANAVALAHNVSISIEFKTGNTMLSNDPRIATIMRTSANDISERRIIVTNQLRTMAGEDFSEYLRFAPGAFAFLGVNNPDAGSVYPHHHPKFTIDEKMLPVGTELLVRSALRFLAPGA